MAKLKCTDRKGENGEDIIQEFELSHAQRILDVKHPQKGWILADPKYRMEKGKITEVAVPAPIKDK